MLTSFTPRLTLTFLVRLPHTTAQSTLLPQCIQKCITTQSTCALTSIYCLCQASNSFTSFLLDLASCITSSCSPNIDISLLLTPLQIACQLDGEPIPEGIVAGILNGGGGGRVVTTTFTVTGSNSGGGMGRTTVTSLVSPISSDSEIQTETPSAVIVTETNSEGSTYTTYLSNSGLSSGIRTSSLLSITTITSPSPSTSSTSSTSSNPSPITTNSTAAKGTQSSSSDSKSSSTSPTTSKPSNPKKTTDSAPFTDTKSGALRLGFGNGDFRIRVGVVMAGIGFVGWW